MYWFLWKLYPWHQLFCTSPVTFNVWGRGICWGQHSENVLIRLTEIHTSDIDWLRFRTAVVDSSFKSFFMNHLMRDHQSGFKITKNNSAKYNCDVILFAASHQKQLQNKYVMKFICPIAKKSLLFIHLQECDLEYHVNANCESFNFAIHFMKADGDRVWGNWSLFD